MLLTEVHAPVWTDRKIGPRRVDDEHTQDDQLSKRREVATPDRILTPRSTFSSPNGRIERCSKSHSTNAARPADTVEAASVDPPTPTVAANPKIAKAQASDDAMKTRIDPTDLIPVAVMGIPSNVQVDF